MSFAAVNAAYSDLREALRVQVGLNAIADLNIRPPAGADEASFLRLVAWCYSVVYEAGRISIAFLLKLTFVGSEKIREQHEATKSDVHRLRTTLFHNLDFDERHLDIRKQAAEWFIRACGTYNPTSREQWGTCFEKLCAEITALLVHCNTGLETIVAMPTDREEIFRDLRRRLSRDWSPHEFDQISTDAAARLGESINPRAFRDRNLASWRQFLEALPEDADLVYELNRRIDADVHNYFQSLLPLTSEEIMRRLDLAPGPIVKRALDFVRQRFEAGTRDPDELLQALEAELRDARSGNK